MAAAMFHVSRDNDVNVIELALPEFLDSTEFDRLNDSLKAVFDGRAAEPWLLDLAGVKYLGSAVLGLIVNIRQHIIQANGKLVLCNLSQRLGDIFRATSLQRIFKIVKARPEALRALR